MLGTCEHCAHILAKYSDAEITALLQARRLPRRPSLGGGCRAVVPSPAERPAAARAARLQVGSGRKPHGASGAHAAAQYKEVQIHGPVDLRRDVEALVGA